LAWQSLKEVHRGVEVNGKVQPWRAPRLAQPPPKLNIARRRDGIDCAQTVACPLRRLQRHQVFRLQLPERVIDRAGQDASPLCRLVQGQILLDGVARHGAQREQAQNKQTRNHPSSFQRWILSLAYSNTALTNSQ